MRDTDHAHAHARASRDRSSRRRLAARACLCLALALLPLPAVAEVILHAFNWRYADVAARAEAIRAAGYGAVLVAPAYKSSGSAWWARYQPQDYRVVQHALGDTEDFAMMVKALSAQGVATYADIVFNHMANEAAQRRDLHYPGAAVLGLYASSPAQFDRLTLFGDLRSNLFDAADFGPALCISNYEDEWQVRNGRLCGGSGDAGLPDLVATDRVVDAQRHYLRALEALGVRGFRIDAAKHMGFGHVRRVFDDHSRRGLKVFGEIITGGGAGNREFETFLKPYLRLTDHAAYDFPLHATLRDAFRFGGSLSLLVDPQSAGRALPGERAITFAITHDIPNNTGFRGLIMDATDETLAYAFLLGRAGGSPLVYSDNNESGDGRWRDAWRRADLVAMIRFHEAAQGSDMQVLAHGDCHLVFRRGSRGLVGINKCAHPVAARLDLGAGALWWNTDYVDVLGSGSTLRFSSSNPSIELPPRAARMWLR